MVQLTEVTTGINSFFEGLFSANSPVTYGTALVVAVVGVCFVWVIRRSIVRRALQWQTVTTSDYPINKKITTRLISSLCNVFLLVPFYIGISILSLSPGLTKAIDVSFLMLFTLGIIRVAANLVSLIVDTALRKKEGGNYSGGIGALMPIIRTLVWALGITFLLDNLGFQISAIVAGLGIMGVAVGLAGQTILADFFSYLVILLDRPFAIGDAIAVNGNAGTIERIGIKTTRVRAVSGEIHVYPNSELTKKDIANYGTLKSRTKTFTFGVTYETPSALLERIPEILDEIAAAIPGLTINRAHLVAFADSSLNFEVSITVAGNSYATFLDQQQALFLSMIQRFAELKIDFAYPVSKIVQD